MTWAVSVVIYNNTKYSIDIVNNDAGLLSEVSPGGQYGWTTSDPNNTNSLRFFDPTVSPKTYYMQGGVSFGPEAGVYMDRGWMAPNDQSIALNAKANDTTYNQTQNGGATVLPWNDFEQGGSISMTFNPV